MPLLNLRHSVRAVVLDDQDRILLCRFALQRGVVWASPGGGIEPGETPHAALRRELHEEIGLVLDGTPPHVWHRRVVEPGYVDFRWWQLAEITNYQGPDLFGPRDLAAPLGRNGRQRSGVVALLQARRRAPAEVDASPP